MYFTAAIAAAFPAAAQFTSAENVGNIARCSNPTFGDFQCNNALGLAKALKALQVAGSYTGRNAMINE